MILSKGFNGKTRLNLSPEEKRRLLSAMLSDIHGQLECSGRFERIFVATPDTDVVDFCSANGFSCLRTDPRDINCALREVRKLASRQGCDLLLVTASDLPFFSAELVDAVLARLEGLVWANGQGAVFCPSRNLGLTVCAASPPDSVALSVDDRTPNLLRLDRVAGSTPRALELRMEAFLDIDSDGDLAETYRLMAEMPELRSRGLFRVLERYFEGEASRTVGGSDRGSVGYTG